MILRLSQNGATRSGGAPSHTSTFLQLLSSGAMQQRINNILVPTYQKRYNILISAIATHHEPLGVKITTGAPYINPSEGSEEVVPAGCFFTYTTFLEELPGTDVIAKRAKEEHSLTIAYGQIFVVRGDEGSMERARKGFGMGARLCWAWHEEDEIEDGIKRLTNLLKVMLSETNL